MASLYLVSSGMADSWCLLRSNYLTIPSTGEKNLSNQGNMTSITCCCVAVNFETFPSEYWLLTKSIQGHYQVELNECGMEELFSDSRKAAKPAEQFKCLVACCLCSIGFRISVNDFGRINKYISSENLFRISQSMAGVDKNSPGWSFENMFFKTPFEKQKPFTSESNLFELICSSMMLCCDTIKYNLNYQAARSAWRKNNRTFIHFLHQNETLIYIY